MACGSDRKAGVLSLGTWLSAAKLVRHLGFADGSQFWIRGHVIALPEQLLQDDFRPEAQTEDDILDLVERYGPYVVTADWASIPKWSFMTERWGSACDAVALCDDSDRLLGSADTTERWEANSLEIFRLLRRMLVADLEDLLNRSTRARQCLQVPAGKRVQAQRLIEAHDLVAETVLIIEEVGQTSAARCGVVAHEGFRDEGPLESRCLQRCKELTLRTQSRSSRWSKLQRRTNW